MTPEKWTRADLVEFVKEVIGEQRAATERFGMVQCYRGSRSLELTFNVHNQVVGVFLVPIPAAIAAVIADPERNPYDNLGCSVRSSMTSPEEMVAVPVNAPTPRPRHEWRAVPHEFMGRADRDCDLCGLSDRAEVHKPAAVPE